MKIIFSQKKCVVTEEMTLLADIEKTRYALDSAYSGFDNVTDPDLIDCYIYQVNAILKRYKFLLEQAAKCKLLPASDLCQKASIIS